MSKIGFCGTRQKVLHGEMTESYPLGYRDQSVGHRNHGTRASGKTGKTGTGTDGSRDGAEEPWGAS